MTERQKQLRQKLDDEFWPNFAKHRGDLVRIIVDREVRDNDVPLVVVMALHMIGLLDRWEADKIDKLPPPVV